MQDLWRRKTCLAAVASVAMVAAAPANALEITFTAISTTFSNPIGIDYHEPTNSVVVSHNYASGTPTNFARIDQDGNQHAFSSASGFTNEVKIATVRSGGAGGFTTGDLFTGNGVDGQIARITDGGSTVINPWVDLPGAGNGLMRGSLYVDRTGKFGGDLIAVTTNGEVWRGNSAGTPTFIADAGVHLEGLTVVPDIPSVFGDLAGKIIAGAEGQSRLYAFDCCAGIQYWDIGFNIEDIDIIDANSNFFGVNFGTGKILGAEASQFTNNIGDILLTDEFHSDGGLRLLKWDFANNKPLLEVVTIGAGSAAVGQWEHVTFAQAGIVEIPPTVPEPAALVLLGVGLLGLALARRRLLTTARSAS